MKKKVAAYSEILYHLINFRTDQFQQLKKMLGIDYDSFMILSVMGAHYLKHGDNLRSDWEAVWEDLRTILLKKSEKNISNHNGYFKVAIIICLVIATACNIKSLKFNR